MKKYTAITIGPIYKTFKLTRSTKSVWTASYLFSYLMRNIIKKGIDNGIINKNNIIVPYYDDNVLNGNSKLGVGLFPDRFIYEGDIKTDLLKIISDVIDDFVTKLCQDINCNGKPSPNDMQEFFKKYFRIIPIEADISDPKDVIFILSDLLDTAELQQNALGDLAEYEKYFIEFLEKYNPNYNFLHQMEFGTRKFKSTAEIATAEFEDESFYEDASKLIKRNKENDQEEYYKTIKEGAGDRFRNYQKYMVIVQADGDNFGDFIKELYTQKDAKKYLSQFSKNLWEFSSKAVEKINNYNGVPIYAGGDDLLFFAPVAHTKINDEKNENVKIIIEKTVFTLIDEIDGLFKSYFTNYKNNEVDFESLIEKLNKKPSMSYGLSISYYKFPLNEAFELGISELFEKAKKTYKKNAVSYSVLKHSGQFFGTLFHKDENSYKTFKKLMNDFARDDNFIRSIAQKLEPQEHTILSIAMEQDEDKRNALFDNFFENNFDESVHLQRKANGKKELIPFLQHTKQLFKDVYSEKPVYQGANPEKANKSNLNKLYASLRFLEFINNKIER